MTHSYIINQFAGIICTICQYVVCVKSSLFSAINQHERKNASHPINHTPEQCQTIVKLLQEQMEHTVLNLWNRHNESTELARTDLMEYLISPAKNFHFCMLCNALVHNPRIHKRNKHFTSCREEMLGYQIQNFTENDPKIIPESFSLNNQTLFCDMFQVEWTKLVASNSLVIANANSPETTTVVQVVNNLAANSFQAILEMQLERFDSGNDNLNLYQIDHQAEPSPWLNRFGYDSLLGPFSFVDLKSLTVTVQDTDESMQRILKRVSNTLRDVKNYVQSIDKNNPALFHVNRISDKYPIQPYNPKLKQETWERYHAVIVRLCVIVLRLVDAIFEKPNFDLTDSQQASISLIKDDDVDQGL
jgi:hypothetical protein